ncbi:MAG: hypothetical protein LBC35_01310 [Coriobacteriales bacterium]|jgi:hypothetical protein|nr:hypothetical protein [Coriobacteriales bacterium]
MKPGNFFSSLRQKSARSLRRAVLPVLLLGVVLTVATVIGQSDFFGVPSQQVPATHALTSLSGDSASNDSVSLFDAQDNGDDTAVPDGAADAKAPPPASDKPSEIESVDTPQAAEEQMRSPRITIPALPVDLPVEHATINYNRNIATESWEFASSLPCAQYALTVLQSLRGSGVELVHAGYLDMVGESWGCAVDGGPERSLAIVLLPQNIFAPRDVDNELKVTVIRYLPLEES